MIDLTAVDPYEIEAESDPLSSVDWHKRRRLAAQMRRLASASRRRSRRAKRRSK